MALMVGDRPVHKLSVDDVYRMLESGVLTEDSPVELLEGVLVEMSPKSPEHSWTIAQLDGWLLPLRAAGTHLVRTEQPLVASDSLSMPEPDLSVVGVDLDRSRHPQTALLVVEVSISSLRTDRIVKSALYASAGVPDYWIVDVEHRRLEVRREPEAGEYRHVEVLGPEDDVTPLGLDLPPLELARIL